MELTELDKHAIRMAVAEIDLRQAAIDRRLTLEQRVHKAISMIEGVRDASICVLMEQQPSLSRDQAQREVLRRYYQNK